MVTTALMKANQLERDMDNLEQLKQELERVKQAIYMKEMSDDYCYSNGSIRPLHRKESELKEAIRKLEETK